MAADKRAEQYREHIEQLLDEHGIDVDWRDRIHGKGKAYRRRKLVRITPPTTAARYLIALHEIGHVVGRHQSMPVLVREAAAWQWALNHRECEVTEFAWRQSFKALCSYWLHALHRNQNRRGKMIVPEGGIFWDVFEVLQTNAYPKREDGQDFIRKFALRWGVLFFSAEMGEDEIRQKLLSTHVA